MPDPSTIDRIDRNLERLSSSYAEAVSRLASIEVSLASLGAAVADAKVSRAEAFRRIEAIEHMLAEERGRAAATAALVRAEQDKRKNATIAGGAGLLSGLAALLAALGKLIWEAITSGGAQP